MAIAHNLTIINNSLSGYDPVSGEVDGTTIGRNYIVWQVFQGLKAFDSNVVMVSSSGDTPSWLAPHSGTIMSTPAKNATTANQRINWYYKNDLGLSGSIPNVFVYEWGTTADVANSNSGISVGIRHIISGSPAYYPFTSGSIVSSNEAGTGPVENSMYAVSFSAGTTTIMNAIPNVIFWKSKNANMVMGINKIDGAYRGYLMWHNPSYIGYMITSSLVDGNNFRAVVFNNAANGFTWEEGFTQNYETDLNGSPLPTYLSRLSSAGLMPTMQFTISGSAAPLTSKLNLGLTYMTEFKAVSEELEGVYLTNSTAYSSSAGTITQFHNSKYYLACNTLNDGITAHKLLVEIGL